MQYLAHSRRSVNVLSGSQVERPLCDTLSGLPTYERLAYLLLGSTLYSELAVISALGIFECPCPLTHPPASHPPDAFPQAPSGADCLSHY